MGRLKWCLPKVDIMSGCLTIMVYFCNNEWVFILTKVQLYCVFVFGYSEFSNTFLLSHKAYILISGIKWKKKFFFKKFPAKKISYTPHMKFWWLRKKIFFSISFNISKCTHWAIKMTASKSWYHFWLSHNKGLFL